MNMENEEESTCEITSVDVLLYQFPPLGSGLCVKMAQIHLENYKAGAWKGHEENAVLAGNAVVIFMGSPTKVSLFQLVLGQYQHTVRKQYNCA